MTRRLVLVLLLAAVPLALALRPDAPARAAGADDMVLRVGDTFVVEGAPIGCQVVERSGRPTIDCRRAGRAAGTYMALFDARRVRVARFRSRDTASVVFSARHRGRARRCDRDANAGAARRCDRARKARRGP